MVLLMVGRTLKLTVALCGLAGAVYAADQAAQPPKQDVNKVIVQQLVTEGQLANTAPNAPADNTYTAEQMTMLAAKYRADMQSTVEHAETVRLTAYRSHDIIRMTCVEEKIAQMKTVGRLADEPALMLRTFKSEPIVMRTQFDLISQVHDRIVVLGTEVDACMGDNLNAVSTGRINEEQTPTTVEDPFHPPSPFVPVERPPEASPYN
jgi:hypothetical protein